MRPVRAVLSCSALVARPAAAEVDPGRASPRGEQFSAAVRSEKPPRRLMRSASAGMGRQWRHDHRRWISCQPGCPAPPCLAVDAAPGAGADNSDGPAAWLDHQRWLLAVVTARALARERVRSRARARPAARAERAAASACGRGLGGPRRARRVAAGGPGLDGVAAAPGCGGSTRLRSDIVGTTHPREFYVASIEAVYARQILDSRGNPTVEVEVVLDDGTLSRAAVPSGASTGALRGGRAQGRRAEYGGKGVDAGRHRRHRRDPAGTARLGRRRPAAGRSGA